MHDKIADRVPLAKLDYFQSKSLKQQNSSKWTKYEHTIMNFFLLNLFVLDMIFQHYVSFLFLAAAFPLLSLTEINKIWKATERNGSYRPNYECFSQQQLA